MMKKYIGTREFYKNIFALSIPMMLQNLITNFVNLLDNFMVGLLGTEEVAAVAIVNQLVFIFNLTLFGAVSGAGIFATQYFGKEDYEGVRYTIRFKSVACVAITALFAFIFIAFGRGFVSAYLSDGIYKCDLELAHKLAMDYLIVIVVGFVPMSVTQIYASTLKESGQTFVPMIASFSAVAVNMILNVLLIFGVGFFPRLGVVGAAIGTTVSRLAECAIVLGYVFTNIKRHKYFKGATRTLYIPLRHLRQFLAKGIPLLINECFWSLGMSLLTLAYSRYGLVIVAAQSISSTVLNFFNIAFKSFGFAVGIVAGKRLGAGEFDEAIDEVGKLNAFSIAVSVLIGVIAFFAADHIVQLYNVAPEAKNWAVFFIKISAFFMPAFSYENSAYFTLRSGGKIFITFLMDGIFLLLICAPCAFVMQMFAPIAVTFTGVQLLSVAKAILGAVLIKRKTWVRSIVE